MYRIRVEGHFSSAHNLRAYKGKCETLHGHNWKVVVILEAKKLDKIGMAVDFQFVKKKLNKVLEQLDHRYLNKIPYFKKNNPTSENISRYIYERLEARLSGLRAVTVWESQNCAATYYGE